MKGKLREFYLQLIVCFEFLDTPGDEVAPGSNEIRKDFENKRFWHKGLLSLMLHESHGIAYPIINMILCLAVIGSQKEIVVVKLTGNQSLG